jgi:hypothetical protein
MERRSTPPTSRTPPSGGQAKGVRAPRVLEVEHVAPVVRRRAARGVLLHPRQHRRVAPGAGGSGGVDVVAGLRHAAAEVDGRDGALLAETAQLPLELSRGLEVQRRWVEAADCPGEFVV